MIRFWNALLAVGDNTGYEPCDSGKLISSRRRYEIWNMIRGSQSRVLDDMRHDSGKVSIAFHPYDPIHIAVSLCLSLFLSNEKRQLSSVEIGFVAFLAGRCRR